MGQCGNIFFALFGAVGLVGVIGASTTTVLKGPVSTMARVTDQTMVKNDMMAATQALSQHSLARADADCDGDGMIEPLPHRAGPSGPVGGGVVPANLGVSMVDPWKTDYGYCAWDHGYWTRSDDIAGCGGASAGRLNGAGADHHPVIVLVSAGPNGVFETNCHDYVDDAAPLTTGLAGGDDIVRAVPYGQFMMPSSAQARLDELPDAACTPASVGLMRVALGIVQRCTESGWTEISSEGETDLNFTPVTNAMLGASHQSNTVTFGILPAPLAVTINNGGRLSINGGGPVVSGIIASNDTLTLSGTAPTVPETERVYTVTVGAVTRHWRIITRDAYIGKLTITPSHTGAMTVNGPGNPAYGATIGFIVSNEGERPVGPLSAASLSNTTHFAFHSGGAYVGDDCAGKILQGTIGGPDNCVIDVRPKATADTPYYEGTLTIADADMSVEASMSGSATGWGCHVPWGGYIANGASVTAFATACSLLSCTSQTRQCTDGVLSGSFQYQTCNVLLSCL